MGWKAVIKRRIPAQFLNTFLSSFPYFYRTSWVNYESNMDEPGLLDLEECLREAAKIPGDLVECGSSRCGTSILMAQWLRQWKVEKTIYACDSFEGYDRDELERERAAGLSNEKEDTYTSTNFEYVCRKLEVLGFSGNVRPVKGYVHQTLPALSGPFCFVLVDTDLMESMSFSARCLFDKLSPGAWMAFDDYACPDFKGAKLAVDQFVKDFTHRLTDLGLRRRLYLVRKIS
jgi:hypothetical protein